MTKHQQEASGPWIVSAEREKPYVDGRPSEKLEEVFNAKDEAEERKRQLQSNGWVASAEPVKVTKKIRENRLRKRQLEPFGPFNRDWKLTE